MAVKTVIAVKAKEIGFYGLVGHLSKLMKVGEIFHLRGPGDFSTKWMEFATPEDEELYGKLKAALTAPAPAQAPAAPAKPVAPVLSKPAAPAAPAK